ncbi:Cupredoxin [Xylariaceae sp. FL0662B]|nr:Cupredoxin [Xylariaceae sp. FL0662B]
MEFPSALKWAVITLFAFVSGEKSNYNEPKQHGYNIGTSYSSHLPKCLTDSTSSSCPWEASNASNKPRSLSRRDTGVTRTYDLTISRETAAPDGVEMEMLLVNGQFPGPLIESNWGDWLQVSVHNNISDDGTAIHWHGTVQKGTPWMDGVPGVSQCPIAPGSSYTYLFKTDLYGTGWYHSHYEAQSVGGLAGPMVVYGPNHVDYDIDVGPVAVSDFFHEDSKTIVKGFLENRVEVTLSDNNLVNGKNSYYNNNAPLATFNFTSGKTHRLRLINTSAFAVQKVSIDGYNLTIIANDYVPIQPYITSVVTLAPGQRSDILVRSTGAKPTDSMWLRAYKPPNCSPSRQGSYLASAAIFYENADQTRAPTTLPGRDAYNNYCGNDPLSQTVPANASTPGDPGVTEIIPIELRPNGTSNLWYLANRTFRIDYNEPQLRDAKDGNLDFPWIQNVHNYGNHSSIRLIIENPGVQPHPMHLHGHNFWVLQEGHCGYNETIFPEGQPEFSRVHSPGQLSSIFGGSPGWPEKRSAAAYERPNYRNNYLPFLNHTKKSQEARPEGIRIGHYGTCWDGSIVNPTNPQLRDVQMLLPGSFIVIQWNQDNPGIWPLHCHIAWHISGGFGWMVLERPDDIGKAAEIPDAIPRTCDGWASWTSYNIVDQIDSGL